MINFYVARFLYLSDSTLLKIIYCTINLFSPVTLIIQVRLFSSDFLLLLTLNWRI